MTLQSMSFIFGAILLAVGILGGGFEIKEIKVSNVSIGVRIVAGMVGLFLSVLAFGSSQALSPHPEAQGRGHLGLTHGPCQSRPKPCWRSRYPSSLIAIASTSEHSTCQHKITKRLPSVTVESG